MFLSGARFFWLPKALFANECQGRIHTLQNWLFTQEKDMAYVKKITGSMY